MNNIIPEEARYAAICNLYLYLAHKCTPHDGDTLKTIVANLDYCLKNELIQRWKIKDIVRLNILRNAVDFSPILSRFTIKTLTLSETGLTACVFVKPDGDIIVAFNGTGSSEWIDNGEGLSGIPDENTYIDYSIGGLPSKYSIVQADHSTNQQVDALNWFNETVAVNRWNESNRIILTGHSKGGNKAQFITIHSDLANVCYSFDGQGFSPEAIDSMKKKYHEDFQHRRQKIYSLSADNDFVNVLGNRLAPENQTFWFESFGNPHQLESILTPEGNFRPLTQQGRISRYVQDVSDDLMTLDPAVRKYATLGVMNIFQKHYNKNSAQNNDSITTEETIAGISVTIGAMMRRFRKAMDEKEHQ